MRVRRDQTLQVRADEKVIALGHKLASSQKDFAIKAAVAPEKRLADVAGFNGSGCPAHGEAEVGAFLTKHKRVVDEGEQKFN